MYLLDVLQTYGSTDRMVLQTYVCCSSLCRAYRVIDSDRHQDNLNHYLNGLDDRGGWLQTPVKNRNTNTGDHATCRQRTSVPSTGVGILGDFSAIQLFRPLANTPDNDPNS